MTPQEIYQLLNKMQIKYQVVHHPAVLTTAEADRYVKNYSFAKTKNLFLRTNNRKHYFLYVLMEDDRFNEKSFRQSVGTSRLSFASPDELSAKLNVEPGMVSPFNLLNDTTHQIPLIVSQQVLLDNELIGVHPNDNTQTVILKTADLLNLLKTNETQIKVIND
jgi:Ala-tRNA(Pro) deacylase